MGKFIIISLCLTFAHFGEDVVWFLIGRHTEISFMIVALGIISFSLIMGYIIRLPKIKAFFLETPEYKRTPKSAIS